MATDLVMPRMATASRDAFYQQPQQQFYNQQQQQQLQQQQLQQQYLHQQQLQQQQLQQQQLQQQYLQQQQLQQQQQQQQNYSNPIPTNNASGLNYSNAVNASNFTSQYNPQISPLSTSNNGSPNSPQANINYHGNRVRPMYMPAVLRPNEHPSREVPAGAMDNNSAVGDDSEDGDTLDDDETASRRSGGMRSSGSFISLPGLPGLGAFGIGRLSRRSTNDSGKCISDNWNLDLFPEVNGLPSRSHWKPDTESAMCDEPTCKKSFNYFTRRHHCRKCGNIFCDFHSGFEVPLDEKAAFNPRGTANRACAYCYREFRTWRQRTNSSDMSSTSSGSTTPGNAAAPQTPQSSAKLRGAGKCSEIVNAFNKKSATAPTSPVMTMAARIGGPGTPTMAKAPDVAQSVPGDWNWSTF